MKTGNVPVWIRRFADRLFNLSDWFYERAVPEDQITRVGWWLIRFARWVDDHRAG